MQGLVAELIAEIGYMRRTSLQVIHRHSNLLRRLTTDHAVIVLLVQPTSIPRLFLRYYSLLVGVFKHLFIGHAYYLVISIVIR